MTILELYIHLLCFGLYPSTFLFMHLLSTPIDVLRFLSCRKSNVPVIGWCPWWGPLISMSRNLFLVILREIAFRVRVTCAWLWGTKICNASCAGGFPHRWTRRTWQWFQAIIILINSKWAYMFLFANLVDSIPLYKGHSLQHQVGDDAASLELLRHIGSLSHCLRPC